MWIADISVCVRTTTFVSVKVRSTCVGIRVHATCIRVRERVLRVSISESMLYLYHRHYQKLRSTHVTVSVSERASMTDQQSAATILPGSTTPRQLASINRERINCRTDSGRALSVKVGLLGTPSRWGYWGLSQGRATGDSVKVGLLGTPSR